MAEETDAIDALEATETDIFQQQAKTIDLLYDVLQRDTTQQTSPTYVTQPQQTKPAPNYLPYIVVGAVLLFLWKGK